MTQHVDKKSLQLSKSSMVHRSVAAKFNADLGNPSETAPTRAEKTVHVRFRLINCIFSDDLSSAACDADNVDRSVLDSGAVDDNSPFWMICEEHFNNGFPVNSIDGPTFTDKLHFNDITIDNYHEGVNPSQFRVFSSSELWSLWKEIQKEYDKVITNFKKSGNHNSSFTKTAMNVYRTELLGEDESEGDDSITSADVNDVFGVVEGGFCCFTNSIVIIYLYLWLNERPGLSGFISRNLPDILQVDTMIAPAVMSTNRQQSLVANRAMN